MATAPGHRRRPSTNPSLRSSTSSLAPSAIFSTISSYGTPRSSIGNGTSLPELPEAIACNGEPEHEHWCTYGEHPKSIRTCEGWKRHEREHEVPYVCMPNGPVENTDRGTRCALCFEADPDADHLARHKVSICAGKLKEPLKKSRKTDMIVHLAKHRVHSKEATALAEQWRYSLNKKYFSCGLCVTIFLSITERSNHIDNEHWRKGQNMDAWKVSNCIKGLLLEPKLQAAWRSLLKNPDVVESDLHWEKPLAEGLQLRLEKGQESPAVLAEAVLEFSNWGRIRPSQKSKVARIDRERLMFHPPFPTSSSPAATTAVLLPNNTYQLPPNYRYPHAPFARFQTESLSSGTAQTSGMEFSIPRCDAPPVQSALFATSFQSDCFSSDTLSQQDPPIHLDTGEIPSHLTTSTFPTEWSSMDTDQILDDSPRIRDHLIESGALLMSQMSSPRLGQSAAYAISDEQAHDTVPRNDFPTSHLGRSLTSSFYHGSMTGHSNHGYGYNIRDKPLPPEPPCDLPTNADRATEHRPNTPMDFCTGSNQYRI